MSQDNTSTGLAEAPVPDASCVLAGQPAEAMRRFTKFVGLDVHKRTVMACVLDASGRKLHQEEFACRPDQLERFARQHLGPHAAVALEATTNTWAVCNVLRPFCGLLKVSNPLKTKAIAQASVKTDKVDANVLGQLLRCDYLPGVWVPDDPTRQLRQLVARRTALVQDRTAVKNRIHSILAGQLIAVPTARLYDKNGLAWLREIQLPQQARAFVDSDLRVLELLENEIALLEKELAAAAHKHDQAKLLMTLPGVDYTVAMTLLAALGDISRFADGDHAAGYLGLAPSTKQSAEHCYHGPITKHGNSHARWMLVEAAQHLDKHPGPLGVFFRRLAKKKNPRAGTNGGDGPQAGEHRAADAQAQRALPLRPAQDRGGQARSAADPGRRHQTPRRQPQRLRPPSQLRHRQKRAADAGPGPGLPKRRPARAAGA
jgi:transposase